jgi:predicted transcriptional regulator of viral defense system
MARSKTEQVLELVRRHGILRPRDLSAHGVPREYLSRLVAQGLLERPTRGIYILAGAEIREYQSLLEACKRVPHGVICLLSALLFHNLTTQAPFEIWMAIAANARRPRLEYPPLRIVRFSRPALSTSIEEHVIDGVAVRVTNPARTVVDCFKYRNKIGLDVAIEALRDCWRQKQATMDQLYQTAKVGRMANVMRPYLESLT